MQNLNYPIDLKFHIATLSNDFTATDATGKVIAYTRQKKWRLREHVEIFSDTSRRNVLFEIRASNWLDFNTSYAISHKNGAALGKVSRKGLRSLWSAKYHVIDAEEHDSYQISEENPWIKFIDESIGGIPIIGWFTGYILNPTYIARDNTGKVVLRMKKNPSFFGRRFTLHKISEFDPKDEALLVMSFMMMILLERDRG